MLRLYLLGDLSAKLQEQLEIRLMTDQVVFAELLRCEEELIDEYVRDELTADERDKLECLLGSPQRRKDVRFAAALRDHVEATPAPAWGNEELGERQTAETGGPRRRVLSFARRLGTLTAAPIWRPALAAALAFFIAGAVWLAVEDARIDRQLEELAATQATMELKARAWEAQLAAEKLEATALGETLDAERAQNASLAEELEELRRAASRRRTVSPLATVASAWLTPGLLRGAGDTERLIVPSGTQLVRLQLDIGIDDYTSYRAALHDVAGDEMWSQAQLQAEAVAGRQAVVLVLPAELLPQGDFSIRLTGVSSSGDSELIGRYYLRVLADPQKEE